MKAVMVLYAFLTAIVNNDLKKAFSLTSKTWADNNKPDDLKKLVPGFDFFETGAIKRATPTSIIIDADLSLKGESKSVTVELSCESWPGKTDAYGDWGVVPESFKVVEYAKEVETKETVKPEPKKASPAHTVKKLKSLIAQAEDMGIDVPEGAETEALEKLIAEAQNGGGN